MKRYVNKLKSDKGSSMILVILAMAIVTIIIFLFTKQVGNQLNSTTKNQESLQYKYEAESVIEEGIGSFIELISVKKASEHWNDEVNNKKHVYTYYKISLEELTENGLNPVKVEELIKKFNFKSININSGDEIKNRNEIYIDADEDDINNKTSPDGNIKDTVNYNLEFKESGGKSSSILIKLYDIHDEDNYKISYDVKKWRSR